jgi:sulfotransferase
VDKKYYYLVGLPRSGNTLLSSILNQNSQISVTANSIFPSILWNLHKEKENNLIFSNFPDYSSYDNMMKGLVDNYYKDWSSSVIIDRAAWGSKNNLMLIEKYCPNKPKFIVLLRSVTEVLASFIKWSQENPINFINSETNNASVEEKCDFLMQPHLQISQELISAYNLYNKKDKNDTLFITYNNLISNTEEQLDKIYSFIETPRYPHRLTNIDQFSANYIQYNDEVVGKNLHTINSKKIEKVNYNIVDYLPQSVIEKYSKLDFWTDNNEI